ncbi:MAG: cupin domain-containing protein [Candidatus Thermoplasmatota archaeon]|nr:cupin domain-containing protein [Candidatus Thermoplasmatota archaeon]
MRTDKESRISFRIPDLEDAAMQFIIRILSMWFDEVIIENGEKADENQWMFPLTNVYDETLDEYEKAVQFTYGFSFREIMPLLGPGRVFATIEFLEPGQVSARLHSHSVIDEFYLIIEGSATLRTNNKLTTVRKGDLISKPAGPDLTSQIIADQGNSVRILDIEVHPYPDPRTKEVLHYPDHGEIYLRGHGWGSIIPDGTAISPADFSRNYEMGYFRKNDGSWEPGDIPGYRRRKECQVPVRHLAIHIFPEVV